MSELDQQVAGEAKMLARQQVVKARFSLVNAIAPSVELGDMIAADKCLIVRCSSKQNAALLECFSNRGDAVHAEVILRPVAEQTQPWVFILRIGLTARKYERAGSEVNLVVAAHHEEFESVLAIANDKHCGGRQGGGWGLFGFQETLRMKEQNAKA